MDWNLLLAILSFVIGLFAGFEDIWGEYTEDPFRAARTRYGMLYLGSRGILPAILYLALYGSHLIEHQLLLWSLFCGTGTETILHAKIFVKEGQSGDGTQQDLTYGALNLLRGYQNFFFNNIEGQLDLSQAKAKIKFIRKNLPKEITYPELDKRVRQNLIHFNEDTQNKVTQHLDKLLTEYNEENQKSENDKTQQYKLCHGLKRIVGDGRLEMLLKEDQTELKKQDSKEDDAS